MASTGITVVLGASDNPSRYSYLAVERLQRHGRPVVAIGRKHGFIGETVIQTGMPALENVATVTLYLNALHQAAYYDYILSLKPRRIIFNPGAENDELARLALEHNIQALEACTLVMLSTGQY